MISVGIDVSKGKSKVCIMKPGGEVLAAPYDVQHTKSDLTGSVLRFCIWVVKTDALGEPRALIIPVFQS